MDRNEIVPETADDKQEVEHEETWGCRRLTTYSSSPAMTTSDCSPLRGGSKRCAVQICRSLIASLQAVTICTLICVAAAADGYQYTLNGNIIANQGFINTIGFPDATGKFTLNGLEAVGWCQASRWHGRGMHSGDFAYLCHRMGPGEHPRSK